jgi:O-acetyl-ADP-ribose deacetylase (regulator of RNase III)
MIFGIPYLRHYYKITAITMKEGFKMKISETEIELVRGDITDLEVDAIVNAANEQLILGGGVAGVIRRKGGPSIQKECDKIGGTQVGGAVITKGGDLKAKYVIHAVGPRMGEGDEDRKLANAVKNSLYVAEENHLSSIAFPAISTGIFRFPRERCAGIMISTIKDHFERDPTSSLRNVVICLYDHETFEIFRRKIM